MEDDLPITVDQAVKKLVKILPSADKEVIASMKEEDLITLHFGLGTWIRNNFGLWGGNTALLSDAGKTDPDEAASIIINSLWRHVRA